MSLYSQATDLQETKRPSIRPVLSLDFEKSKVVDPRVTFTRNSIGTYIDSNRVLRVAPANSPRIDHDPATGECKGLLIEEQRTNLLNYTEYLEKVSGVYHCLILPNFTLAPDGLVSAPKAVVDTVADTQHWAQKSFTAVARQIYTYTIYAKAGEYSKFNCFGSTGLGSIGSGTFDLSAVTASASLGGTASITPVGNGWFRCTWIFTPTGGGASALYLFQLHSSTSATFTGDGKSGMYFWGWQLEAGAFPTSYIPSTNTFNSRASTATYIGSDGLIKTAAVNEARYQYNPLNLNIAPKLLLEGASTNLVLYSEQFDVAPWSVVRSTVTPNAVVSPDGTSSADKLVEDTTIGNNHKIQYAYTNVLTYGTYCFSVYVKAAERKYAVVAITTSANNLPNTYQVVVDLNTGNVTATYESGTLVNATYNITKMQNGWYRCSVTCDHPDGTQINPSIAVSNSATPSINPTYNGDGISGIYIWGAQLEFSKYATSYIPTTSATVTRSADVSSSTITLRSKDIANITDNNFTSWFNNDEGTFCGEFRNMTQYGGNSRLFSISDGTYTNRLSVMYDSSGELRYYANTDGSAVLNMALGQVPLNMDYKVSCSYKNNNFSAALNGALGLTDTTGNVPIVNKLSIGNLLDGYHFNGHVKSLRYYDRQISEKELQVLTM